MISAYSFMNKAQTDLVIDGRWTEWGTVNWSDMFVLLQV